MHEFTVDDVLELAIAIYFQYGFSKYDDATSGNPALHVPPMSEMIVGQLLGITEWVKLDKNTRQQAENMRHRISQLFLEKKLCSPELFSLRNDIKPKANDYLECAALLIADKKPISLHPADIDKVYSLSLAPIIVMREDRRTHYHSAVTKSNSYHSNHCELLKKFTSSPLEIVKIPAVLLGSLYWPSTKHFDIRGYTNNWDGPHPVQITTKWLASDSINQFLLASQPDPVKVVIHTIRQRVVVNSNSIQANEPFKIERVGI
jgi:hypothetical protein